MPNWCKGSLKVRGKISDLKKFVQQGLEPVSYIGDALEPLVFTTEDETSFFVRENKVSLWMKGTHRHFCEPNYIEVYADDQETPVIMILPMKAAWSIDAEPLQELCKKFHVDMKIQGFERGMEFSQVIEIVIVKLFKMKNFTITIGIGIAHARKWVGEANEETD